MAEVGEDDLLEVDLVHLPARVVHVAACPHEERRLAFGVALADHLVNPGDGCGVAAGAGQETVARDDFLDRADELRLGLREDDQMVADPLQVGDDVR